MIFDKNLVVTTATSIALKSKNTTTATPTSSIPINSPTDKVYMNIWAIVAAGADAVVAVLAELLWIKISMDGEHEMIWRNLLNWFGIRVLKVCTVTEHV